MTTISPGYHDNIEMDDYIHDRISPEPSLSTGVVHALVERSPLHAWHEHPRLGGKSDDSTSRSDIGSAVHALSLGGAPVVYIDASDWRTKAAQEARENARTAGKIALLERQREQVESPAAKAKAALAQLGAGKPEQTMLWQSAGVWHRGRADWLTDDGRYDVDIKTTENADPNAWIRSTLVQGGYDCQAALRICGHEELSGHTRDFVFLLVEINPPYATSLVGLDPAFVELGKRKVAHAEKVWRECLRAKHWPAYPDAIHWATAPSWAEYGFEDRITNQGGR